jgi:hypothetical protein
MTTLDMFSSPVLILVYRLRIDDIVYAACSNDGLLGMFTKEFDHELAALFERKI